jgi:hypothetical protein
MGLLNKALSIHSGLPRVSLTFKPGDKDGPEEFTLRLKSMVEDIASVAPGKKDNCIVTLKPGLDASLIAHRISQSLGCSLINSVPPIAHGV